MKMFKAEEYINMENPDPGKPYRPEVLTYKDHAKDLGGIFGLLVPGSQVPYHYHKNRESVIIAISGEAIEIIEGEELPFKAGWVIHLPAGERHMAANRSDKDFRSRNALACEAGGLIAPNRAFSLN